MAERLIYLPLGGAGEIGMVAVGEGRAAGSGTSAAEGCESCADGGAESSICGPGSRSAARGGVGRSALTEASKSEIDRLGGSDDAAASGNASGATVCSEASLIFEASRRSRDE